MTQKVQKVSRNKKLFGAKISTDLIKRLKYLSADLDKPLNAICEEAFEDILKKYSMKK